MECNLVWNHTCDFKIEWARSTSFIWDHKYDFSPKLHNPAKFNCHFVTSILKLHNLSLNIRTAKILVSTIIYWTSSWFVKKWNWKCIFTSFWKHVKIMSMWLRHVIGCFVWQKIVWFVNKLRANHIARITRFQNGFNT